MKHLTLKIIFASKIGKTLKKTGKLKKEGYKNFYCFEMKNLTFITCLYTNRKVNKTIINCVNRKHVTIYYYNIDSS